jgi:hypothetical protein
MVLAADPSRTIANRADRIASIIEGGRTRYGKCASRKRSRRRSETASLLDHFVGQCEQHGRYSQAKCVEAEGTKCPEQTGEGPMNLADKAGIVTGAGRGIGRSVALLMAREGASVIVNDPGVGRNGEVTTERPADEVVAEIAKAGGDALANYDSVADYASAGRMVRQCADTFGKIDFVVNAAGVLRERMIWNMTEDDFDAVISVHLKGTWNMSHHAIKLMRSARTSSRSAA